MQRCVSVARRRVSAPGAGSLPGASVDGRAPTAPCGSVRFHRGLSVHAQDARRAARDERREGGKVVIQGAPTCGKFVVSWHAARRKMTGEKVADWNVALPPGTSSCSWWIAGSGKGRGSTEGGRGRYLLNEGRGTSGEEGAGGRRSDGARSACTLHVPDPRGLDGGTTSAEWRCSLTDRRCEGEAWGVRGEKVGGWGWTTGWLTSRS